jgi:hypothetical protein
MVRVLIVLLPCVLCVLMFLCFGGLSGNSMIIKFLEFLPVKFLLAIIGLVILLYVLVAILFHLIYPSGRRFVITAYSTFLGFAMTVMVAVLVSPPIKSFRFTADGSIAAKKAIAEGKTELEGVTSQTDAATAAVGVQALGTVGLTSLLFCIVYFFVNAWELGRSPFNFNKGVT